jgi:hypothetical protein
VEQGRKNIDKQRTKLMEARAGEIGTPAQMAQYKAWCSLYEEFLKPNCTTPLTEQQELTMVRDWFSECTVNGKDVSVEVFKIVKSVESMAATSGRRFRIALNLIENFASEFSSAAPGGTGSSTLSSLVDSIISGTRWGDQPGGHAHEAAVAPEARAVRIVRDEYVVQQDCRRLRRVHR